MALSLFVTGSADCIRSNALRWADYPPIAARQHLLSDSSSLSTSPWRGGGPPTLEVITAVGHVCGRSVQDRYGPDGPGRPPELVADTAMARATIRLHPHFAESEWMVRTVWGWRHRQMAAVVP